jgi:Helicase HerA, central domain
VIGAVVSIKGRDVEIAFHPAGGEPRLGDGLLLRERGSDANGHGVLAVQVIGYGTVKYPGDSEAMLAEILEDTLAERHDVVTREPAMRDLKEIKVARCKIRKRLADGAWVDWDGSIPSRNVDIEALPASRLLEMLFTEAPAYPVDVGTHGGHRVPLDGRDLDKVNALVGLKGSGKSHLGKLLVHNLTSHGAPCWVFDINREFVDLPGADVIRIGRNYHLVLDEVGFPFLMAVIDSLGPLTDNSRGALEHLGPRMIEQEVQAQGFATVDYLLERAEQGRFHNHDTVNNAIAQRLRMVRQTGIFATRRGAERLSDRFDRVCSQGGFLVFDLAEQRPGILKALTRGLNRRLEAICDYERQSGRGRYPFVFFEEAHFYAAPEEILNLITRGRHLGLTTFFITNSPGELPEVIFRQLDNLIVTGLSHAADLRTIAKCSLSDEDTLQSIAVGLGASEALVVGRVTGNYPLVMTIDPLPSGFPPTGQTRSFWRRDHADAAGDNSHAQGS